jgi:hypothetical protein
MLSRQLQALLLGLTLLISSCGKRQPTPTVSSAGRQLCHERQADAPPGTSVEARRGAFRVCLQTIDAQIAAQNQSNQIQRRIDAQRRLEQQQQQAARRPSEQDRFVYCRQVREQVITAERLRIRSVGPAMVAARRHGPDSFESQAAQAQLDNAMATLEQLIPETMRAGRDLLPDAVQTFMRCDPADFPVN